MTLAIVILLVVLVGLAILLTGQPWPPEDNRGKRLFTQRCEACRKRVTGTSIYGHRDPWTGEFTCKGTGTAQQGTE